MIFLYRGFGFILFWPHSYGNGYAQLAEYSSCTDTIRKFFDLHCIPSVPSMFPTKCQMPVCKCWEPMCDMERWREERVRPPKPHLSGTSFEYGRQLMRGPFTMCWWQEELYKFCCPSRHVFSCHYVFPHAVLDGPGPCEILVHSSHKCPLMVLFLSSHGMCSHFWFRPREVIKKKKGKRKGTQLSHALTRQFGTLASLSFYLFFFVLSFFLFEKECPLKERRLREFL